MFEKALQIQLEVASFPGSSRSDHTLVKIVEGHGAGLNTVDRNPVAQLLHDHGVVLFRDFDASLEDFVEFSARFCTQFLEHGSKEFRPRRSGDGTVAQVLVGNNAVSLHAEMNYSPLRPDLLWFYCTQPAPKGGQTLVADSREVLANLNDATRKLFEARRIRYRHILTPDLWQYNTKQTERDQAVTLLNFVPGITATPLDADSIQMDFETDAIRPTGRSGELGFINSIANIAEYAYRSPTSVTFADGEPISDGVLWDIALAEHATEETIEWQPQDLVMIDNTRVMHGRAPFEGDGRKIDVRFGMLAPDLK